MAGLKDIKIRISAVSSNMKITSAMKMVSASKFKKSVDRMHSFKLYQESFFDIKNSVLSGISKQENIFSNFNKDNDKILFIVVASNRGLCGPFNMNISKKLDSLLKTDYLGKDNYVISLSKKIYDYQKKNLTNIEDRHDILDNLSYEKVSKFANDIIDMFLSEKFSKIIFLYNSFKNASTQIVKDEVILPLEIIREDDNVDNNLLIFEPSKKDIVNDIIPQSIRLNIFRILLESVASEHGARMTAMHKATENATDLKKSLLLEYNKIRQASITNQIIEIVSGAEAV